jgi:hypothetical protein
MHGEWTIVAHRLHDRLEAIAEAKVLVESAAGLRIDAAFNRPEYRPGDSANVRLSLTDNTGKPVVGALSLAMVNEAVYFAWPDARADGGSTSAFSLQAETYGAKQTAVAKTREERLEYVHAGWVGLAAIFAIAAYVFLWLKVRTLYVLMVHGVVGLALVCGGVIYLVASLATENRSGNFAAEPAAGNAQFKKEASPSRTADQAVAPPNAAPPSPPVKPQSSPEAPIETLLWRPIVITDETGKAEVDVSLGPTVAAWRFTAQAVAEDGRLAGVERKVRVTTQPRSK